MIVGIDESNFSPSLSGDCVVCAFARTGKSVVGIDDSKKLSPSKRLELFGALQGESLYYVVPATPNSISKINVYKSRNIAIASAVRGLCYLLKASGYTPSKVIIYGYWSTEWKKAFSKDCFDMRVEGAIRGDESIYEVSAASIVAKVYCDCLLAGWDLLYPKRGIGCDHGSLTEEHKIQLRERGPSPVHRTGVYAQDWWDRILNGGDSDRSKIETLRRRVPEVTSGLS